MSQTKNRFIEEPAVVLAYGPSKTGKTTDCLYSFPRGVFFAQPGALKPSAHVIGYSPDALLVTDIITATEQIEKLAKKKYDAVIVDDFSLLTENTIAIVEKKASGMKMWGLMRDTLIDFRNAARNAGIHVVLNAHEAPPKTIGAASMRGGPRLPGKMVEDFPAICDIVVRSTPMAERRGWPYAYRCSGLETSYITGDRHGVTPDYAPMNLGEIMRLAGYPLRRAEGLEWQDDVVASLTTVLAKTDPDNETAVLNMIVAKMREKGRSDIHIRWVLRDSLDRVVLQRALATGTLASFNLI